MESVGWQDEELSECENQGPKCSILTHICKKLHIPAAGQQSRRVLPVGARRRLARPGDTPSGLPIARGAAGARARHRLAPTIVPMGQHAGLQTPDFRFQNPMTGECWMAGREPSIGSRQSSIVNRKSSIDRRQSSVVSHNRKSSIGHLQSLASQGHYRVHFRGTASGHV